MSRNETGSTLQASIILRYRSYPFTNLRGPVCIWPTAIRLSPFPVSIYLDCSTARPLTLLLITIRSTKDLNIHDFHTLDLGVLYIWAISRIKHAKIA